MVVPVGVWMSGARSGNLSLKKSLTLVLLVSSFFYPGVAGLALGVVMPVPLNGLRPHVTLRRHAPAARLRAPVQKHGRKAVARKERSKRRDKAVRKEPPAPPPQDLAGKLSRKSVAPGVVYEYFHGPLNINVLDIKMSEASLKVRPVLAGQSFSRLADVKDQVRQCRAIAAVNANYFKKDGTPLGTLMIDREWVAGPLYDRVSLGITRSGFVRIDRVDLYGTLRTSNLAVPSLWVNNINQPRRHGSHLVLYTRRWGNQVRMAYAGCLIAVDASGKVVEKTTTVAGVPPGGYVLSDSKGSPVSRLRKGDYVNLSWHTRPASWADVEQAVSGGPMLIKDGQLYVDLKAERFRKAWTGRQIHARTAAGVTADNHLLLVTIEGSHTLWDFAKFMLKLGAVDAMNLDGGGSTTMVVGGATVTRNARTYQRRVASSLAVVESATAESRPGREGSNYVPSTDLSDFAVPAGWLPGIYPGGSPEMMPLEEAHGPGGEPGWLGKVAEPGNIISQAGQPDRVP